MIASLYRTFLSILADLDNAIVYMVLSLPLISLSISHFFKSFGIVPSVPSIFGITVIFMFHRFFNSLARQCICLSFWFFFFSCFLCDALEQ